LKKETFDWKSFSKGSWADEFPGLRELIEEKAAKQKEKRDDQAE
jgi:hypothetical protein